MLSSIIDVWPSGHDSLPSHVHRETWGEMMVDATLWRPVVETIATAVGLDLAGDAVAGYPGSSAVFLIGRQAVVKLFPPFFARDFDIERTVYGLLHRRVDEMPRLLASGVYHDRVEWPFLVLSFCAGEPIRTVMAQLAAGERRSIAQQAGGVLRQVHATPLGEQEVFAPWPAFLRERQEKCLHELRDKSPLPAGLLGDIAAFLEVMAPLLAREPGLLVNADLTDDHALLVEGEDGWRLSAVIDWADAEVAHPAYEWIAAWFGFCRRDPAMFRALVSACRPEQRFDAAFRRELLAMTFLHRFGALIVAESWQAAPPRVLSLAGLQEWLWPW